MELMVAFLLTVAAFAVAIFIYLIVKGKWPDDNGN
jgi:hypothetical protein